MAGYAVARLEEIDELTDGREPYRPVRHHLGITAFGATAWTGRDVGDRIINEHDEADESTLIAAQPDGQFIVDALTPIAEFNEQFGADFPDDEYDTVGGFVTSAIGHLPEAGEELSLGRFHFRVGRADRRRVQSFVVSVDART